MPKFEYTLSTTGGRHEEGVLIAENREVALKKLRKENKIILSCNEAGKKKRTYFWQRPNFSYEDKMIFTKHLYAMVKAGITLTEAIQVFANQTKGKRNRQMFENIMSMLKSGQSLAKSLKPYNYIFSDVFINMIATGEESGTLEQVLDYLAIQLEKEYDLRKKIKGAFIYPIVILSITLLMALGIVIFIMPKVTKIFTSFDMVLPLPTRMLIWFSNFITYQWYFAVIGIVILVVGLKLFFALKPVQIGMHRLVLRLPVFGNILKKTYLARFSRTMNSLLQSGIPVTRALQIVGDSLTNTVYKTAVLSARQRVEQGGAMTDSFTADERLFPPLMVKILMVGDKTGSLEESTKELAEIYEKDVDNITRNLSTLMEPLLLVFMGIVVGGLALSIVMPIYQLPSMIQR
ncbi:MAG: type II secretion system F family protein [Candidatus Gracilibacteria bacterium]